MASTLQSVSAPAAALALLAAAAARLRDEIGGGAGWVGDAIERLRGSLRDSPGTLPSSPLGSGAACSPQTRQSHSRS